MDMKTTNQRTRSGLTRGEILVLIDAMEHHSGLDPNTFQIARLKESLNETAEKNRTIKHGKGPTEVQSKKN
jgi:hypothetical protein